MGHDDERPVTGTGLTRQDLLQRGAAAGLILATGGFGVTAARAAGTPTPAVKPTKGGTLRVALGGLAASQDQLNPFIQYRAGFDQCRAQSCYSRLYQQQPDGSYLPELAESAEPNKTVDQWQVKLKSGVVWHDGSPFTADDVTYTYGAILSRNPIYAAALANFPMIKRVVKVNAQTVKFVLNRPWADFPIQLGQNLSAIMKAGTTTFGLTTPGTGPWKLQSWTPGTSYVLQANENWSDPIRPTSIASR